MRPGRVGYVHAISIEIAAAADNLEGPCTTKIRKRIAYAHRHVGKVYIDTLNPFLRTHALTMNHACRYKK